MGNIDCKCLKEYQEKEIVTTKGDSYYTTTNNFGNTQAAQAEDNNIDRAKAQNFITPKPEKENNTESKAESFVAYKPETHVNQISQSFEEEEIIEIPPILNENYMDYTMDFFDEINKYRCESDLFIDLKKDIQVILNNIYFFIFF